MRMRLYLNCFLSSGHSPQYIISETNIEYTYASFFTLGVSQIFLSAPNNKSRSSYI